MYRAAVWLLMLGLPAVSIAVEATVTGFRPNFVASATRWFVFWGVGVRLFTAGIRQIAHPRFTAEAILGLKHEESFAVVRELGFANVAMGALGIVSIIARGWILAGPLVGAIFYGLAGLNHTRRVGRNANENLAMVSDLLFAALLAVLGLVLVFGPA